MPIKYEILLTNLPSCTSDRDHNEELGFHLHISLDYYKFLQQILSDFKRTVLLLSQII